MVLKFARRTSPSLSRPSWHDVPISTGVFTKGPYSKIASVLIKGAIQSTSATTGHFGIVAQHIVAVKVGGTASLLKSGPQNDGILPLPSGIPPQMTIRELQPLG